MRKGFMFLGGSFLIFLSVALVDGQPGGGKKGTGGGGFGGFGPPSPITLLNRTDVKEELKLTDDQTEKLPAEVMVAISKVLDNKQFKRFKQIEMQTRGNNAFKDKAVLKELKVSDDQAKSLVSVLEESDKEMAELRKSMFGGGGGKKGGKGGTGGGEKIQNLQKETKEKLLTVLTKDQRKQWRDMIGEEFKMQQGFGGGFGGGGGFGKKGADKKDAKKDN